MNITNLKGVRDIKGMARAMLHRLRPKSPDVNAELLLGFIRRPRLLLSAVEIKNEWFRRKLLSIASNLEEPFLMGRGLTIQWLGEESIEVKMPGRWPNRGFGGNLDSGALTSLGEFTSRIYWEHFLDAVTSEIQPISVHLQTFLRTAKDVRACYQVTIAERESIMFQLRADGRAKLSTSVVVFDLQQRMVARIDVEWQLTKHRILPEGGDGSNG